MIPYWFAALTMKSVGTAARLQGWPEKMWFRRSFFNIFNFHASKKQPEAAGEMVAEVKRTG